MSDDYRAPDLASVKQCARETGAKPWEIYKLIARKAIPHLVLGERGKRVLMKPYRRLLNGEPIPSALLSGESYTTDGKTWRDTLRLEDQG